jgi:hypothetical protein
MKVRLLFLGGVSASAASIFSVPMLGSQRFAEYRITPGGKPRCRRNSRKHEEINRRAT